MAWSRLPWAALAGLLAFGAAPNVAAPAVRQVLLLQSFDRGNLSTDYFTSNFRVDLDRLSGSPVNVVQVVVGPSGPVGAPGQAVVDYIQATFTDRPKPDLIVTVAGPAAVFARQYRRQLFPDTPLLFAAVDQRYLRDAPLGENETAVPVANDGPRLVDEILQLLPQTKQVFMVTGSGQLATFWHRELDEEFRRFHGRLTFVWSDDLSLPEIVRRCASLPRDSAIFFLTFGTDAERGGYADERVLAELHATANAPMFGVHSVFAGYGIVGGTLMSIDDLVRNTADVADRLLNGAPPRSINAPPQSPGPPVFDWRELQRWGIPENRLPAGSAVLAKRTSFVRATDQAVTVSRVAAVGFAVFGLFGAYQLLLLAPLLWMMGTREKLMARMVQERYGGYPGGGGGYHVEVMRDDDDWFPPRGGGMPRVFVVRHDRW